MDNNQLLHNLRRALDLDNAAIVAIVGLTDTALNSEQVDAMLSDPEAEDFATCPDRILRVFLEGLIISERGPRDDGTAPNIIDEPLTNNQILKKLRVAFNLQEADMQLIFEEGGASLSAAEFGALFRRENNSHYRACSDELLQQFLAGLTPSLDS